MRLWHDDIRRPPDDSWIWVRTNLEAKMFLQDEEIEEISLDHDLGLHEIDPDKEGAIFLRGISEDNGYQLVCWMVLNEFVPQKITIHSWNPDGAKRMAEKFNDYGYNCIVKPYEVIA